MVKRLSAMQGTRVWSPGWEHPLEKEIAAHSSTLAWKISWTEEPSGLQSIRSQSQTWLRDFTSLTMSSGYKYICPLHDNYTLKVFKFKINWPNLHTKVNKKYKQLTRKLGKAHRHIQRIVNSCKSEATHSTFHTNFRNCYMSVIWEKKEAHSFITKM